MVRVAFDTDDGETKLQKENDGGKWAAAMRSVFSIEKTALQAVVLNFLLHR